MLNRKNELDSWLAELFPNTNYKVTALAGDASHRRYYRININDNTKIVMDAPPNKVKIDSFIEISHKLKSANICVPNIYNINRSQGFLLLDDFGDELFLQSAISKNADTLYHEALLTLIDIQKCSNYGNDLLEFNKEVMLDELQLFKVWFVQKYLDLDLKDDENQIIKDTFNFLIESIYEQPQVFIHRDYHSRNLMLIPNDNNEIKLGIIDYQDAMCGPFTYDLVSLLKDCYIQWPYEKITTWLKYFYNHISFEHNYSLDKFTEAFNLCGLQRHLKVLGIFVRLHLRDNKPNYLSHLPLTFNYIMTCLECYNELKAFQELMQKKIQPYFLNKLK